VDHPALGQSSSSYWKGTSLLVADDAEGLRLEETPDVDAARVEALVGLPGALVDKVLLGERSNRRGVGLLEVLETKLVLEAESFVFGDRGALGLDVAAVATAVRGW
jgi:hypothetical protein